MSFLKEVYVEFSDKENLVGHAIIVIDAVLVFVVLGFIHHLLN